MPVKVYKPTTPARRGMSSQDFDSITGKKPLKSLLAPRKQKSGRNNQGRITTRHKGGGAKKFYRIVDFKLLGVKSLTVEQIEYDPNRSARIARVKDENGNYHYILASQAMKNGTKLSVGEDAPVKTGNRLPISKIPAGSILHNIELVPGKGGQLARSAGVGVQLMGKEGNKAHLKLPSGEVRLVSVNCYASLGVIGNEQHQNIKIGKAGRNRHKGIRPSVRGVVMNAADHPHGGGDGGRHGIGGGKNHGAAPKTPWGQKTLGFKTRRRKSTDKFIVRSRHKGKRK
ncbi:MAG TPA: 50S ribosomal protein L2 [Candidatus Saccharimonadales bacterium]|nr:50S ribosomal protein L2 [Candidatus Saccharimonadales bacterium]